MEIGNPIRRYTVVPLKEPVPQTPEPLSPPTKAPSTIPTREKEKVD